MREYLAVGLMLLVGVAALVFGQGQPPLGASRDPWDQVLEFIYTAARWLGQLIVNAVQMIIPSARIPDSLIDPIGLLAILTIFLAAAEIVKKLTWIVVIVGWLLIFIRLVMVIMEGR